jgi:hypothetical protein
VLSHREGVNQLDDEEGKGGDWVVLQKFLSASVFWGE